MSIRRTVYTVHGKPVSLPFVHGLADEHPEAPRDAPTSPRRNERPQDSYG